MRRAENRIIHAPTVSNFWEPQTPAEIMVCRGLHRIAFPTDGTYSYHLTLKQLKSQSTGYLCARMAQSV